MSNDTSNRPTHRVYAVIKKQPSDKGNWREIGAAWSHKDGKGFSLVLDLLPPHGAELVMRSAEASEGGAA